MGFPHRITDFVSAESWQDSKTPPQLHSTIDQSNTLEFKQETDDASASAGKEKESPVTFQRSSTPWAQHGAGHPKQNKSLLSHNSD